MCPPAKPQAPGKAQSLQKNIGQRRFVSKAGNNPDMRLADIHKPLEDTRKPPEQEDTRNTPAAATPLPERAAG